MSFEEKAELLLMRKNLWRQIRLPPSGRDDSFGLALLNTDQVKRHLAISSPDRKEG